jgi:formylglycine-generating enzyme required for sulfatase activity/tRNA A-37 threonylcarbamoyl transferase component Bud32
MTSEPSPTAPLPTTAPLPPDSGAQPALPFTLAGAYEVTDRIGQGGMGDVYLAYEGALDRKVAIKILPADLARSPEFVRRFQAEATAAAKLAHPNVIRIHRIGEDAGRHFFVMDYVAGESLAGLLERRSTLTVAEALAIAEHVLAGLAAAHEQGLVHRDVKPGNILLETAHRRALLADFGLAKVLESSATRMTATGVVVGTLDYLSPEQGRGQPIDGRSDLYSLGVVLYRMLSGRLPFAAEDAMGLIFQHVNEPPPPLAETAPHVPRQVAAIVERLMAKSPVDRYQNAAQVLADVHSTRAASIASGTKSESALLPQSLLRRVPTDWWGRVRAGVISQPRQAAAVAVGLFFVAVLATTFAIWGRRQGAEGDRSRGSPPMGSNGMTAGAQQPGSISSESTEFAGLDGPALLNSNATPKPLAAVPAGKSDILALRFSRDGRVVTAARADGTITVIDAATGQTLKTTVTDADFSKGLALSPDGQLLVTPANATEVGAPRQLQLRDLRDGTAAQAVAPSAAHLRPLAISDDRRKMWYIVGEGASQELVRWNAVDGTEIERKSLPEGDAGAFAQDPVGSGLALTAGAGEVLAWRRSEPDGGITSQSVATTGSALALHARRGWLGVAHSDGTATLWDLQQNRPIAEFSGMGEHIRSLAFDASGRRLTVVTDTDIRVWDLSLDYVRMVCPVSMGQACAFSSDGSRLATASGVDGIQIWNAEFDSLTVNFDKWLQHLAASMKSDEYEAAVKSRLPRAESFDPRAGVSRDGRLRVRAPSPATRRAPDGTYVKDTPDDDYRLRLEDMDTGNVVHWFQGKFARNCCAVSPDGRIAASGGFSRGDTPAELILWDVASGAELQQFTGNKGTIESLAFSPDGTRLLSGGSQTMILWDVASTREIMRWRTPMGSVNRVTFSPDGRLGVATSVTVPQLKSILYDLETGDELLEYALSYPEFPFAPRDLVCDTRYGSIARAPLPAESAGAPLDAKLSAALDAARNKAAHAAAISKAFAKAHAIVYEYLPENETGDVRETLQAVAADLPRLNLSTKADEVVWNHTRIEPTPARFVAYAFTSPLDEPGDLYWFFSCHDNPLNWFIVPAEGTMQGFTGFDRLVHPHYQDPKVPIHDYGYCQSLTGGHILPGKDYILWFAQRQSQGEARLANMINWANQQGNNLSDAQRAAVEAAKKAAESQPKESAALSIALRLVPAATTPASSQSAGIARRIGPVFAESTGGKVLYQSEQPLRGICVTPDGREVAVCDGSETVRLWDRETSMVKRELEGDGEYSWVVASADGKRLAAGVWRSMQVSLWDLESGDRLPDLVIGWTKEARDELRSMQGGYVDWVAGVPTFIDDSRRMMLQMHAGGQVPGIGLHHAVLWDLVDNQEVHRLVLPGISGDGWLVGEGKQLFTRRLGPPDNSGQREVEIARLDWETGEDVSAISLGRGTTWGRLLLSPDQKRLGACTTRGAANYYEVFDAAGQNLVMSLATMVPGETMTSSTVQVAAWSPDSRFLALGFADASVRLWDVQESRMRHLFRGHLEELRSIAFTPDGKSVVSSSTDGTVREWPIESPLRDSITDSLGLGLVPISAGEFTMGTVAGYKDRWGYQQTVYANEQPQHHVRISRPFYMGRYEVTVGQFRKFVEATGYKTTAEKSGGGYHMSDGKAGFVQKKDYTWRTPGFPQTDDHPVVQVSWLDAQVFCEWLSKKEDAVYRLPTEAEWEYACRAGHDTEMWNSRPLKDAMRGEDTYGNVADAAIRKHFGQYPVASSFDDTYVFTAPVGVCNVNDFGLYDMHGNVFEWCSDWHNPIYYGISPDTDPRGPREGKNRVQRGGSFYHHVDCSRCNFRGEGPPEEVQSCLGFRVVREIP